MKLFIVRVLLILFLCLRALFTITYAAGEDADGDSIEDAFDFDRDNDGIPDVYECNPWQGLVVGNFAGTGFDNTQFLDVRPADFGLLSGDVSQTVSTDFSSLYGLPIGSIVVTITNAHRLSDENRFYLREDLPNTQVQISGSYPVAVQLEQGQEYGANVSTRTKTMRFVDVDLDYVEDIGSATTGSPAGVTVTNDSDTFIISNTGTTSAQLSKRILDFSATKTIEFGVSDLDNANDVLTTYYFRLKPLCDYDNDTIPDIYDLDSDNDGCVDAVEGSLDPAPNGFVGTIQPADLLTYLTAPSGSVGVGSGSIAVPRNFCVDVNGDSACDVSGPGYPYLGVTLDPTPDMSNPAGVFLFYSNKGTSQQPGTDTDNDGFADACDLDKDNDGITDVTEIGPNPLNPRDTDGDGTPDYLDNDSDGDGCYDAIEGAGNVLASQVASGGITGTVDNDGIPSLVNGGQGTGVSLEAGKIDITTQPQDLSESVGGSVDFGIVAVASKTLVFTGGFPDRSAGVSDTITYQRQINVGSGWNTMTGETGTGITLTPLTTAMDGNQYRVVMTCTANTCDVFSEPATLAVTTDASYAVQHYREQIDGTHTLIETDNLTGTIAATVTGSYNDYSGSGYVEESTYVDTLLTGTVMSGGSLVLKLYYVLDVHTVTFDVDGDTATESPQNIRHGGLVTNPTNTPTKTGYTFAGYKTSCDATGIFLSSLVITQDTILYACWMQDNVVVGSSGGSSSVSGSVAGGDSNDIKKPLSDLSIVNKNLFNDSFTRQCHTILDEKTVYQFNPVTEKFRDAHQVLYSYGLTTWRGTRDYGPKLTLTRAQAAKFMVEFAKNVLCRKPNHVYTEQFTDIDDTESTLIPFVKQSYEYNIFHGDGGVERGSTTFRPNDIISYNELIAVMVRLVTNDYRESVGSDWAIRYRSFIVDRIVTSVTPQTVRENVAEVMYDLYKLNGYHWEEIGYVIDY